MFPRAAEILIARCPSCTTRTTSTRPVFDTLHCWSACNLNKLTSLKENSNTLSLFSMGCLNLFIDQLRLVTPKNILAKLVEVSSFVNVTIIFPFIDQADFIDSCHTVILCDYFVDVQPYLRLTPCVDTSHSTLSQYVLSTCALRFLLMLYLWVRHFYCSRWNVSGAILAFF